MGYDIMGYAGCLRRTNIRYSERTNGYSTKPLYIHIYIYIQSAPVMQICSLIGILETPTSIKTV